MEGAQTLEITLRPRVPMPYVQAAAPLAALAIAEQVGPDAQVLWPCAVVADGCEIARVSAKAGYDEGMFVRLCVAFATPRDDLAQMEASIASRADAWERSVGEGRAAAGPFSPFASDYFDRMAGMGTAVDLLFPNCNLFSEAVLKGLDMWGRISVELADGRQMDCPPEQVSLRLKA